jgi:antibiotic biosynthesis monooxygenase
MIAAIHLRAEAGESAAQFQVRAGDALRALAARPGFRNGSLARAVDDESDWLLLTEWESVGAYRRALGNYQVKLLATPVLAGAEDRPSAFEPLLTIGPDGSEQVRASDRATGIEPAGCQTGRPGSVN